MDLKKLNKIKMNISNEELKRGRQLLKRKKDLEEQLSDIQEISSLGLHIKLYRNKIGTSETKEVDIDREIAEDISYLIKNRYKREIDNITKELYG